MEEDPQMEKNQPPVGERARSEGGMRVVPTTH